MCLEDLNDDDLAKEIQGGNRLAMNMLVERYQPRIFALLRQKTGNDENARDLTQDVWVLVWQKIRFYRPERGALFSWLFSVAHHRFNTFYRREAKHRPAPYTEGLQKCLEEPSQEIDVSRDLLLVELREQLQRLLPRLSVKQQEVINLYYLVGFTGPQIADQLGVPEDTVHSRKLAALRKLRELSSGESLEI